MTIRSDGLHPAAEADESRENGQAAIATQSVPPTAKRRNNADNFK
jgi:hypothetical protein